MMMTISWTRGSHTSDFSVTTNNQLYFILHIILHILLFSKHYSPFISVVNIFYIPYLLVSCFRRRRWHEIWHWRDRSPPLSPLPANASYLPVSVFITRPTARPRLSDVRTRVSPNLQWAEPSQHLFYISQFLMVQLPPAPSHLLVYPGKLEVGTGGKATSSFIIFTEGSVLAGIF